MSVFDRLKDCEDCRRRREALIAAGKRMAEWIKHPIGPQPDLLNQKPIPTANRLPDPAPTSQEKVGRIDPKGRVRE